jgi:1-acyl-sn-glycerol-3-phosphate acyltransferase
MQDLFRFMETKFGLRKSCAHELCESQSTGPAASCYGHVSMLDWAFLFHFLPEPVRCTVYRDYFDYPLLRVALRINGAIPVRTNRPDPGAIRLARAVLAAGEPLILFPEGGISRTGRPQPVSPASLRSPRQRGCRSCRSQSAVRLRCFPAIGACRVQAQSASSSGHCCRRPRQATARRSARWPRA